MRKKITILFSFLILFNNSYSQWITLYTGEYTQHFEVFFINQNTGWTTGDQSKVFKTTNCGNTWNLIYSPAFNNMYCLYFVDSNKGWAGTFTGVVAKTTNGGNNWSNITAVNNKNIFDINFINEFTGWCVGEDGTLRKTTDGGNSWYNPSTNYFPYTAYSIYFINSMTGFSCGGYNLAKTTDGGCNWNCYYNPSLYFRDLYFINSNTGWAFAGLLINGNTIGLYVMKTTNCGTNWNTINIDSVSTSAFITVKDSYFINENLGYIVGLSGYMGPYSSQSGFMDKTTNGGVNWNFVNYGYVNNIEAITFVNQQTGFAVGQGSFEGAILKTTNGGPVMGISTLENQNPNSFSLSQNYPNPFNPTTNIRYQIPKNSFVNLRVHDLLGREVVTLVNEKLNAGEYETAFDGSNLPSGVYFYKLTAGDFTDIKKMLMIK